MLPRNRSHLRLRFLQLCAPFNMICSLRAPPNRLWIHFTRLCTRGSKDVYLLIPPLNPSSKVVQQRNKFWSGHLVFIFCIVLCSPQTHARSPSRLRLPCAPGWDESSRNLLPTGIKSAWSATALLRTIESVYASCSNSTKCKTNSWRPSEDQYLSNSSQRHIRYV